MSDYKENFRKEQAKIAAMPLPDKISYLFTYYKFHALAILVVLVIAISLLVSFLTKKEELLTGALINVTTSDAGEKALTEDVLALLEGDSKTQMVRLLPDTVIDYSGQDKSQMNLGETSKILAMVANQALDYIIGNEAAIQSYGMEDGLRDLSQFLPEELYETWSDSILTITLEATGEEIPVAIDISDSPFAKEYSFSEGPCYLAFYSNSLRSEASLAFAKYILTFQ